MNETTRCITRAAPIPGFTAKILHCRTEPYRVHYHGWDLKAWPCKHRHQSVNSAIACSRKMRTTHA